MQTSQPQYLGELFDVCARKHKGNKESRKAFQSIKDRLTDMQLVVLSWVRNAGDEGLTCDELSAILGKGENVYSGRFSELHFKGLIKKIGTRSTRNGHPAAVWRAI